MAGIGSLSNNALNNFASTQHSLLNSTTALSTGKKINTAADNPSGLAIYNRLLAESSGSDQASLNTQDALNATNVAQGGLSTISDILQQLNVTAVQASNDFLSPQDHQSLQAAATQQIQQLNQIAQQTNFNGANLLNGQFAGTTPSTPPAATIASNDLLASSGNVVSTATPVTVAPGTAGETIQVSVSAGQAQVSSIDSTTGTITNIGSFAAGATVNANGATFTLGSFSATDTGTATIQVDPGTQFSAGSPAQVQTGPGQGATASVAFPSVTSQTLGVSNLNFATTQNAQNGEGVISQALSTLSTAQSTLGAQTNALQHVINNNNITSTNLTHSASNIADANFGQEESQNQLNKIQSLITLNVLRNANTSAGFLTGLLNHAS